MIQLFRSIYLIINYKTLVVSTLAVTATWACVQLGIQADVSLSMLSLAIVFPIVFAINSAYLRREEALKFLAGIKGHCVSIFLAVKHWGDTKVADHSLLVSTSLHLNNVLGEVKKYLVGRNFTKNEFGVYHAVSSLSKNLQLMRAVCNSSEMSRINEYVSMLIVDFEDLKTIREYRTPITLRTYSRAFIYTFPILFSPFFASTLSTFSIPIITYFIPVVYAFILISLINIQDHMEDPFDGIGEDDIKLEPERFAGLLNGLEVKKELTEFINNNEIIFGADEIGMGMEEKTGTDSA